jgi:type I restriction enzyme S subunit
MTPEVKKRIEQIRQGIVPEGYKKTESGIIPNEWRVGQVSKCIEEYKFFSNDISHIPVYSSSRKGLVPQSDYYNQREAVETNLGYKVVPQGYVTYRHMSDDDVFHFNINKTGENVLVSSEYPVFTSSDNCDLSFLISVLNNTARFRYFCKMQKLGGTRTRLYLDNLKRYALALPPFDEQKKIAEILATQDKAIELQGRKIEELKRFKKGCLEKMFPRKGQKVPEKRFPGFTDDWEQRKAKELFVSTTDKGYPELPVLSATQDRGMIRRDENSINIFHDKKNEAGYKRVLPGQFVIHLRSFQGGFAHSAIEGITSPAYTVFGFSEPEKHDSEYWKYVFTSKSFIQRLETVTYGIRDGRSISYEEFLTLGFVYPSKAEQTAIARYLDKLSDLITLHQRKLEEMKRQKKALMQLLLTGIVRVKA